MRPHLRRSRRLRRGHSGDRPAAAPARRSGLPRAAAGARPPVRGPLLSRRHGAVPRRRCAPPRPARQSRGRDGRGPGRHQRRALPRARAAGAAGRGDGDPARLHRRRAGLPPLRQRRAASEISQGDGAPVPPPSARHRAHAGDRGPLPLHARPAHLPVSRDVRGRRDAHGQARPADLGRSGLALSRGRSGGNRQYDPPRVRADPQQADRALLPDRARDRHAGPQDGHSLPGPRLGRQLRRLLLPRRHLGESQGSQRSCSSASCPTSATSRPTSTSTSSTSGAKRSSSGSTRRKAAIAPHSPPR